MMREISWEDIASLVEKLCVEAATVLPEDLCQVIREAGAKEESPVAQGIFQDMEQNFLLARERGVPICQDTGMAVVFLTLGQEVHVVGGSLREAIDEGVRRGYVNGHLRCSVVADPLRRQNTVHKTPPGHNLDILEGA